MQKVAQRFLEYVKFDTESDSNSNTCPSTRKQYEFGMRLVEELRGIGLSDVSIDQNGYVMATLPSNIEKKGACDRVHRTYGYQPGYEWSKCSNTDCQ